MEQVPDIITEKDLNYLSEIFNWNYNALKVCFLFKNATENNDLKDIFNDIKDFHKEICERIIDILGGTYEEN